MSAPVVGLYTYRGDRMTAPELRGQPCEAVRRPDGKCIVGRGAQLVRFADGVPRVVVRRMLRKILASPTPQPPQP